MKIVVDVQALQTGSRYRGIGRYVRELVKALVATKEKKDEIKILINGGQNPAIIEEIKIDFSDVLSKDKIIIWYPAEYTVFPYSNPILRTDNEHIYNAVIARENPDFLIYGSVFEGYFDPFFLPNAIHKNVKEVAIAYDFIPYQNKDYYLPHNQALVWYEEGLNKLFHSDLVFTISNYVFNEAKSLLKKENIVNINSGKSDFWRCGPNSKDEKFIFYYGGSDDRKNIKNLIRAYFSLEEEIKNSYKLIICCGDRLDYFSEFSKNFANNAGSIVFEGYLSDEQIRSYLQKCSLYVFPSTNEGFGLPLLEAMSCGAPSITSKTSSLPEVINYPEALFDPSNPDDIAKVIKRFITNSTKRAQLKNHCIERSKHYSWLKTAKSAWESLHAFNQTVHEPVLLENIINDLCLKISRFEHSDEEILKIAQNIDKTFRNYVYDKTEFKHFPTIPNDYQIIVNGPYDGLYSLSEVNRNFAKALCNNGNVVTIVDSYNSPSSTPSSEISLKYNLSAEMFDKKNLLPVIYMRNDYPPTTVNMDGVVNAYFCYGWEETRFLDKYISEFNQKLDIIFVLSKFVKKVLIDSGITIPIFVIGCGVDHFNAVKASKYPIKTKDFSFLHISSCFPRKGIDVLLEAYSKAFTKDDDVTLIIKTFKNIHNNTKETISKFKENSSSFPDIQYIDEELPVAKLKYIYEQADAMVLPSRGEGLGLPHIYSIMLRTPLITLDWSGMSDYCNPSNSRFIKYHLAPARSHFHISDSLWAEPDVDDLSKAMRTLYLNYRSHLQKPLLASKPFIQDLYSWDYVAKESVRIINSLSGKQFSSDYRIGWVTTWNKKCGIAEYSAYELHYFPRNVTVFAPYEQSIHPDNSNVVRCWELLGDLDNLKTQILNHKIDVIVFQYHHVFFNNKELESLLQYLHSIGVIIVIEFHNTKQVEYNELPSFNLANRLIVHSISDINRLINYGYKNNTVYIPHGQLLLNEDINYFTSIDFNNLTISSFGFLLPNKGLDIILEAIYILKKKNKRYESIKYIMCNAIYDIQMSVDEKNRILHLIDLYQLSDNVELHTDYLDITTAITMLRKSELIINAYQNTHESASGSVRIAIASGKPVLVTPASIFNDVKSATIESHGFTAHDIANSIDDFFTQGMNATLSDHRLSAYKWARDHSFQSISTLKERMISSLYLDFTLSRYLKQPVS